MVDKLKHWFDPRVPIGRIGFALTQLIGSGIEGALRNRISPTEGNTKVLFISCVLALAALLAIVTIKRLVSIGWSRRWTLVILGPVLFDILFGIGSTNSPLLKMAFYPLLVSYIGYLLLVVVLCGMQGQSVGAGQKSQPSQRSSSHLAG